MVDVLRAIWVYVVVALAIAVAAGLAHGGGALGAQAPYGAGIVAGVIVGIGYLRWDLRHFPETPAEAARRRPRAAGR